MVAMTEEQAALYESMLRDDPRVAALPVLGVDLHIINGMPVLCIATRIGDEDMFAHYTLEDRFGPMEMAAVTELHGMLRFSSPEFEGLML